MRRGMSDITSSQQQPASRRVSKKKIDEMLKKKKGSQNLREKCDVIKHVARNLVEVTCTKVKNENYACQCEKVIKENKICGI